VLFVVIPTAWLAVVLFVWTMCRLAARSDDSRAAASGEQIAARYLGEHKSVLADSPAERPPLDR
jgi:hypothetical protein